MQTIYALEVGYFTDGQGEILVPHLHGVKPSATTEATMGRWTEERFFAEVERRQLPASVVNSIRALYELCGDEASHIYWGTGKQTGSFTFHYTKDNRNYSLFSVYTEGRLGINFGWFRENVPLELVAAFWNQLQGIGRLATMHVREDFKSWPNGKLNDLFPSSDDLDKFKQAILAFRDQIAALPGTSSDALPG
jgi:hypothetical protein